MLEWYLLDLWSVCSTLLVGFLPHFEPIEELNNFYGELYAQKSYKYIMVKSKNVVLSFINILRNKVLLLQTMVASTLYHFLIIKSFI